MVCYGTTFPVTVGNVECLTPVVKFALNCEVVRPCAQGHNDTSCWTGSSLWTDATCPRTHTVPKTRQRIFQQLLSNKENANKTNPWFWHIAWGDCSVMCHLGSDAILCNQQQPNANSKCHTKFVLRLNSRVKLCFVESKYSQWNQNTYFPSLSPQTSVTWCKNRGHKIHNRFLQMVGKRREVPKWHHRSNYGSRGEYIRSKWRQIFGVVLTRTENTSTETVMENPKVWTRKGMKEGKN